MFADNAHFDGSTWRYVTTDEARGIRFGAIDGISFHIASSGSAGNAITNWDSTDIKFEINVSGAFDFKTGTTKFNTVTYTWPGSDGGSGDLLTTNGTGGLSWTAGGGGGIGGSGTAGKMAKWTAGSTLDDSIISDNGSTITINGTMAALDMAGQIDLNTNNIIAGGTAAFTTITASAALIRGANNSAIILSGGTDISNGSTLVMYGESHASQAKDFEFRSDTTVRIHWDDSEQTLKILTGASLLVTGEFRHTGNKIAFFSGTTQLAQTVTGSRETNLALTSLLDALATYNIIINSTSP
jgi:hypothetical protein